MNWSDEILMAFADGELEAAQRAEIERALGADAVLRKRVGALKAQRERLAAAYAPVLDEAVPERLASLLREGPAPAATASVVDLASARAAAYPAARRGHLPTWAQWGGMAASVLLGLVVGLQWRGPSGDGTDASVGLHDGRLIAGGEVAQALTSQLASEAQPGAAVAVQLSFVDRSGSFCRTFSTGAVAGLACRQAGQWTLQQLATADAADAPGASAVRQAASGLPRAVLDAVDQRIAGATLDAAHERAARDRGWQR